MPSRKSPAARAIVLLSEGDTSSPVTFDEVLDVAQRSDSVIYAIGLGIDASAARRSGDPSFLLTRLTQSFKVGPSSTVTVYSEENLRGSTLRAMRSTERVELPSDLLDQVQSMVVECDGNSAR